MTARTAEVSPAARRDLNQHVLWLHSQADPDLATRFAQAAISSFAKLARAAMIGSPLRSLAPHLAGARKWRVEGFPKILIFYLPAGDGIRIIRVLHSAADWWSLLDVR